VASIPGRTSKIKRYYWRELAFRASKREPAGPALLARNRAARSRKEQGAGNRLISASPPNFGVRSRPTPPATTSSLTETFTERMTANRKLQRRFEPALFEAVPKSGSGKPARLPDSAHRIGGPIHLSACSQGCVLD
jgi:hypothetical protein